jgi:solute:Na+ symporter, SSS family
MGDGAIEVLGIPSTETYWAMIRFVGVVFLTTATWIIVTLLTKPVREETLRDFYRKIRPGGPGWKAVVDRARTENVELLKEKDLRWDVPTGIMCMILGSISIYSILFALGNFLYGNFTSGIICIVIMAVSSYLLYRSWNKLKSIN